MIQNLAHKILKFPIPDLRMLQKQYESSFAALIIEQEIRIRTLTDKLKKLERDYINRREAE